MNRPVRPSELQGRSTIEDPTEVLNRLIIKHWNGKRSSFEYRELFDLVYESVLVTSDHKRRIIDNAITGFLDYWNLDRFHRQSTDKSGSMVAREYLSFEPK